jgi:hypothetical protein
MEYGTAPVYPQGVPQVPALGGSNVVTVVSQQTGGSNGYFFKPEFRGQRLTPEQMMSADASAAVATALMQQQQGQQQQQTPAAMMGQPVAGAWSPNGPAVYGAKPAEEYSYPYSSPPPAPVAGIPGFGLPV